MKLGVDGNEGKLIQVLRKIEDMRNFSADLTAKSQRKRVHELHEFSRILIKNSWIKTFVSLRIGENPQNFKKDILIHSLGMA
jgi:hypothetical protein